MGNPNYEAKPNPSVTIYSEASQWLRLAGLGGLAILHRVEKVKGVITGEANEHRACGRVWW